MSKKKDNLIKAALHDADWIYQGIVEVAKSELTNRHLPEVTECDLLPGQYKWDPEQRTYQPLKMNKHKKIDEGALVAIARGFAAIQAQGTVLPAETVKWCKDQLEPFDSKVI